jgi:hypothetical protein
MPRRTKDPAADVIAYFATAPPVDAKATIALCYNVLARRLVDDPMRLPRAPRLPKKVSEPTP